MIIFTDTITPRLSYMADFIGKETVGTAFELTDNIEDFKSFQGDKINYSNERITPEEFWLRPHALLFEKDIKQQKTDCFTINDYKAFFQTEGDHPFDIFAASFYLLSRYEEYLPHQKDMYGRYAHKNSLAFKENFLQRPLINIWLQSFKENLKQKSPSFAIRHSPFTFIPTYDIDEAYSYKYKSWVTNLGAVIKAAFKGEWSGIRERRRVLNQKERDPFDSYEWMDDLNARFQLKPQYFFLAAKKRGKYDRNILPRPPLTAIIWIHADKYKIGIHPSWQSGDNPALLKKEKETIENAGGVIVTSSRQHFIRFTLPETFRHLIEAGITEDFSMGYGSINGFRASVATPFYWYDLKKEETSNLMLYPFCFMEANSFFEQKFSPEQALEEMRHYLNEVKAVNGTLIFIWHNTFLGTHKKFSGWREVYNQFINEVNGLTETVRPG